jgi:hypothetical protein
MLSVGIKFYMRSSFSRWQHVEREWSAYPSIRPDDAKGKSNVLYCISKISILSIIPATVLLVHVVFLTLSRYKTLEAQ